MAEEGGADDFRLRSNVVSDPRTRITKFEFQLLLTFAYSFSPIPNPVNTPITVQGANNNNQVMGISLWSKDGYFLDIEQLDAPPKVAIEGQECQHKVRRIILRNNKRTNKATLCCSHKFFCSVCYAFIINSGVNRILFPIVEGEISKIEKNKDIFSLIIAEAAAEAKVDIDKVRNKMDEILRLVVTTNMAITFEALGGFASTLQQNLHKFIQEAKEVTVVNLYGSEATQSLEHWFYMVLCLICMFRSEDRNGVRVGSVAVNKKKDRLVGVGYNAYPIGVKAAVSLPADANFILHAEQNLLLFRSDYQANDLVIYSTRMPCDLCWPLLPEFAHSFVYWEIPVKEEHGKLELKYQYKPPISGQVASVSLITVEESFLKLLMRIIPGLDPSEKSFFVPKKGAVDILRTELKNKLGTPKKLP